MFNPRERLHDAMNDLASVGAGIADVMYEVEEGFRFRSFANNVEESSGAGTRQHRAALRDYVRDLKRLRDRYHRSVRRIR